MMESFIKEFEHLKIPLKVIKFATNNFDKTKVIGRGGFGIVYRGELSHFKGHGMVAIKRLYRRFGQGSHELLNEFIMLSVCKHENLISLLGFCNEDGESIFVYEYASKGSLDCHLHSTTFTWIQRLKVCLGAARGLCYLHDGKGTKQRVLHRDVKSSNILLDDNWNAKISDMGLSKSRPANQQYTYLMTPFAGTIGYIDPSYMMSGILTKESDVFSFGVVLFEVLCGRLSLDNGKGSFPSLVPVWKQKYIEKKLNEIILPDLVQEMDPRSLEIYSDIAFQCLHNLREKRPTMSFVVKMLATAIVFQEIYEEMKHQMYYENIIKTAIHIPTYKSQEELKSFLSRGVLLNGGKTWFSLNKNGEHCEMISAAECVIRTAETSSLDEYVSDGSSRFPRGNCYITYDRVFKAHVRTQFLSPRITYTVNLVFKNKSKSRYIGLKYKLKWEPHNSCSFLSDEREDGWLTAELYQFTSDQRSVDLEIWFYTECCPALLVEGIEFLPLKKVEHAVLTDDKVDTQPISDNETYWEQKLPIDYKDIIKWSKDSMQWETKKDLYSIFCKGFLISYGEEWFYLAKDGKKCLMLPARAALEEDRWEWKPEPETRFEEVADCIFDTFGIFCKFSSKMLSPQTTYTAFLIYKLPDDYESVDQPPPVQVVDEDLDSDSDSDSDSKEVYIIFLRTPKTPFINWNKKEEKTLKPLSRPKIKGLPKQRSDGWMEVQVHEFQTRATIKMICMCLKLSSNDMSLKGVIVLGLEFRPL